MINIIISLTLVIGAVVFFTDAVLALIEVKRNDKDKYYFNKYILIIGGICSLITLTMFIMFNIIILDQKEQLKDNPKYEQIQEPIYKRIQ